MLLINERVVYKRRNSHLHKSSLANAADRENVLLNWAVYSALAPRSYSLNSWPQQQLSKKRKSKMAGTEKQLFLRRLQRWFHLGGRRFSDFALAGAAHQIRQRQQQRVGF